MVETKPSDMNKKTFHFGAVPGRALARGLLTALATATAMLLTTTAQAVPSISSVGGGAPSNQNPYGFVDGNTASDTKFHTPMGLSINSSSDAIYVADRDNNALRILDLVSGLTWSLTNQYISKPIAATVDQYEYVWILNQGKGTNGSICIFDNNPYSTNYGTTFYFTNSAMRFTNVTGMALDLNYNVYITTQTNKIIKVDPFAETQTLIATVTNAGASLQGLTARHNGMLAVCDSGLNGIYQINPTNGAVSAYAGFHGAGDFLTNGNNMAVSSTAKFNQPMCIAEAGDGTLIVSDFGNNRVKVIQNSGTVTNLYGVTSQYWYSTYPGWYNGTANVPDVYASAHARQPYGISIAQDGSIYTTEDYYHLVRHLTGANLAAPFPYPPFAPTVTSVSSNYTSITLTWGAVTGATNYNVYRTQVSGSSYTLVNQTTGTSYTDTNVFAGGTYYYVVSASNASGESPYSTEVNSTVPYQPATAPQIGYLTFTTNADLSTYATFNPFSSHTFYNETPIVITSSDGTAASLRYTYGATGSAISWPTTNGSQANAGYVDKKDSATAMGFALAGFTHMPDTTLLAIAFKDRNLTNTYSAIVSAQLQYITASPSISGNNAALFAITNDTAGALMYYTIDGSEPTNNTLTTSVGPISTGTLLSLHITTNTTFKIKAYRPNYQPSSTVSVNFDPANYVANTISFGFASDEASSDFVASPGQTFYAPVTLSMLSGVQVYSLQFNITVTNFGTHPVPPGHVNFGSLLKEKIEDLYYTIPTYSFVSYLSNGIPSYDTNVVLYGNNYFQNLLFTNSSANLLGVGWLERKGQTNLYNAKAHDLITYSLAHDILYPGDTHPGKVEVGGYAFQVPLAATTNDYYQIRIGRPSATSDGVGAPGSDVYIDATTNGSVTGAAPINAVKNVTIGQRKYIVGGVAPFRWFNAGDFGSSNIVAADVAQVFQSAVYYLNTPFDSSDLYNGMDSCGNIGVLDTDASDPNYGYYTNAMVASAPGVNLFDGNDTSINSIAFGDGVLDIRDVYVTYRRSLDPSLTWYRRFWNNGVLVADTTANVAAHAVITAKSAVSTASSTTSAASSAANAKVIFQAGDITGSAGQTVQVPITATILGSYPLRVLLLNLTVTPLDGSPALTTPVSFTPNSALGTPYTTDSKNNGNYSAAWLNSGIAGLTGTATIGTLTVTIPAGAPASAAYAVTFDHASASPNGLASFPNSKLTGLLTLASRTNSCYHDGIPDSWRMRWFGTTNNLLSSSNACPSGDGINNWKKFVAGIDPNTPNNFPSVVSKTAPSGYNSAVTWPSVLNKQYVIERSSSLFNGTWSTISTNTGTGGSMEFDDTNASAVRFYRVRILP
jgi:hypothetical protein